MPEQPPEARASLAATAPAGADPPAAAIDGASNAAPGPLGNPGRIPAPERPGFDAPRPARNARPVGTPYPDAPAVSGNPAEPDPAAAPPSSENAPPDRTAAPEPRAVEPRLPELRHPAPLREMAFTVKAAPGPGGDGGEAAIGLRVRLRGGEVQVAVHAEDPRASAQLRRDLGTLAERLDRAGFHAETWRPGEASPSDRSSGRGPDAEAGSQRRDSPDQGSRGRQPEQRHPQRHRPAWVEELEQQKERLS
jgi:hypothetical protein